MRGSIEDALNELGAVAREGAQAIRAIIPEIVGRIKTVTEFSSFARTISEIASLAVTARVELFKVMPDFGPGGGPGGSGGIIMDGEYAGMSGADAAVLEFKKKWG
jgi:hypothetical protein